MVYALHALYAMHPSYRAGGTMRGCCMAVCGPSIQRNTADPIHRNLLTAYSIPICCMPAISDLFVGPMDTAAADLQADFVSALYSTGVGGTYVHGNLHTVYASSSLAQPCITIFPKKRFLCTVCPRNPKSDDGLRACGDGNVNAWSHMGSRVHQSSFRQQTLGLPFDELAFATFTAGNQRRRWSERRAAAAATHLGA